MKWQNMSFHLTQLWQYNAQFHMQQLVDLEQLAELRHPEKSHHAV